MTEYPSEIFLECKKLGGANILTLNMEGPGEHYMRSISLDEELVALRLAVVDLAIALEQQGEAVNLGAWDIILKKHSALIDRAREQLGEK